MVERLVGIPTELLVVSIRGALDLEWTPTGLVPVRLPESVWRTTPDWFGRDAFRMASGVRLALRTRATMLELDIAAGRTKVAGYEQAPAPPLTVDVVVDGEEHAGQPIARAQERLVSLDGDLIADSGPRPVTMRLEGLPRELKDVEVWLPTSAAVEIRALRADEPVRATERTCPRWVHYGSSISHGADVPRPSRTWPAVAARRAGFDLVNLGISGGCHLDQFVARAIRDTPAACISLKVGINIAVGDTLKYRTFAAALHGFLDTVRDGHPSTPILVISPVICPLLEDSPGPVLPDADGRLAARSAGWEGDHALSLRRIRESLEEAVEQRSGEDANLHYLDGLRLFGEDDLAELPDGIHPSPAGHVRIGERFAGLVVGEHGCFAGARASVPTSP